MRWRERWHLLVPAILAAVVRLPAVSNGLPYVSHPDEPKNYLVIHEMISRRSALPRFYNYPSLFFELEAVAHAAAMALLKLVGSDQSLGMALGGTIGGRLAQSSFAWVVARLVVLGVSVAGVLVAARLAERLTGSRLAAGVAGVLAALSTISIASGSVITPDALAGTLSLCAIASAVRVFSLPDTDRDRLRWALRTGVLLGLAVSAKYNTVALALPITLALVITIRGDRRFGWQPVAIVTGAAIAAFLATTPGLVLDNARFMYDVRHELDHYRTGHAGAEGNSFVSNLGFLWGSEGLAVVLALAGLWLRRSRALLVLWSWPVAYLIAIGFAEVRFARNLTPIIGVVAVLAGCAAHDIARRVQHRKSIAILIVASLAPLMVVQTVDVGARLRKDFTDYQRDARDWMEEHVPPGAHVLAEYYTPFLDPGVWNVDPVDSSLDQANAIDTYDVVILTSGGAGRYLRDPSRYPNQVTRIAALRDQACRVERYEDDFGFWVDVLVMNCAADEG